MSKLNIKSVLIYIVFVFYLSGCGSSGGGSGGESRGDGSSFTAASNGNGTALISWMPPTQNTDGSALTDLAGYKIYYGTSSSNYTKIETISNPGLSSFLVDNLGVADWFFVMTVYNSSGIESSYSAEVSTTIYSG
jgi:hypothetical protein